MLIRPRVFEIEFAENRTNLRFSDRENHFGNRQFRERATSARISMPKLIKAITGYLQGFDFPPKR